MAWMACLGLALLDMVWSGVAWHDIAWHCMARMAWRGLALLDMVWRGWAFYVMDDVAWFGFGRHGVVLRRITLNGMAWCGMT